MVDDLKVRAAQFFTDGGDSGGSVFGGFFIEFVPFVSGADAEFLSTERDEPAAGTDTDVGIRPIGDDG